MTEQPSNQSPYQGISGPGGGYAPVQDQNPYGSQNAYGQQQQGQYGNANPYAQQQPPSQNPYGQAPQGPQAPYGQAPQNPYGQAPQNPYGTGGGVGGYGPAPKRRRGPIMLYIRVGVLAVVLIIGGISWLYSSAHKSHRDASGSITKGGTLDAVSLHAGDCYEKPSDPSVPFSSVKAIPCTQPHNAQAFYSFTFPGATSVAPTDDQLTSTAQPQCESAAKTKIDQSKLPQNAQPSMLFADDSTWAQGYHDITCVYENDSDYTGSFLKS